MRYQSYQESNESSKFVFRKVWFKESNDESDTNQVSNSSEAFLDPFAILREVRKKILIGP